MMNNKWVGRIVVGVLGASLAIACGATTDENGEGANLKDLPGAEPSEAVEEAAEQTAASEQPTPTLERPTQSLLPTDASARDKEIAALVDTYLFQPATREEIDATRAQVRALQGEELKLFHRLAIERGQLQADQRELALTVAARAEAKGVSMLDVTTDDLREAISTVSQIPLEEVPTDINELRGELPPLDTDIGQTQQPACSIGYAACSWTNAWNSGAGKTICDPGQCMPANAWDNVSNSSCEIFACDTRIRFPLASGRWVDGVTAAADCVIQWYVSLAKYSSGGNTYVGYGVAGPTACFFFPANPAAHFNLKP